MKFVIAITLSFFALFANASTTFGYVTKYQSVAQDATISVVEKLVHSNYRVVERVIDVRKIDIFLHNRKSDDVVLVTLTPKDGVYYVLAIAKDESSPGIQFMKEAIPSVYFEIKGVTRVIQN
jgi:hypothetical protein